MKNNKKRSFPFRPALLLGAAAVLLLLLPLIFLFEEPIGT